MKEDAPDGPARPPKAIRDRLAEVNGQLTLAALLAQERAEELAERYREQNEVLVSKRTQLRALASDLLLSEQRERKRLAVELHDYLAQMLVLGRLKMGQVRSELAASRDSSLGHLVGETEDIFNQALAYTRTLMTELNPVALRESGLPRAIRGLADSMKKHGLSVEVHASHDELTVSDDQAMLLYHSVRELLLNVIKHAQTDEARLSLSFSEERMLTISVQDEGLGFDADSLEGKTSGDHFGLLSVMERMEALGGSCEIQSSCRQGATVSLRLPLGDMVESDPALTVPAQRVTRQVRPCVQRGDIRKVLLVDDHAMVREGLGSILTRYTDVRVIGEARNGVEAVAMAAELAPDVIVMDINMPQMDGIEATKRITQAQPWVMVIGLSVNNSPQTAEAMKKAGAATLLSKEAAGDELYDAIVALVPP